MNTIVKPVDPTIKAGKPAKATKADKVLLASVLQVNANAAAKKAEQVVKNAKKASKQAAAASKGLEALARKEADLAIACGLIGSSLVEAAQVVKKAQGDAVFVIQGMLDEALAAGLTVDMLKAKRPCYLAIIGEIGDAIAVGTRDNYMSRIRTYVREQPIIGEAAVLDLYGNVAKAKVTRAPQQPTGGSQGSGEDDDGNSSQPRQIMGGVQIVPTKEGAHALAELLMHWINKNAADASLFDLLSKARALHADVSEHIAEHASEQHA